MVFTTMIIHTNTLMSSGNDVNDNDNDYPYKIKMQRQLAILIMTTMT